MRQFLNLLKRIAHRVLKIMHAILDWTAGVLANAMETLVVDEAEHVAEVAVEAAI